MRGIREVSGQPFDRCVEILLPGLSPASPALSQTLEAYERTGVERLPGVLYDGVGEGIRELAAAYPVFIVSNCPGWYLEEFLQVSGLRECFTGWDCHGSSGISKSGMLSRLAATHHLAHAVYVGDTADDQAAAAAAGMDFVFAEWGFGRADGDGFAFDAFAELVQHFLGWRPGESRGAFERVPS